MLEAGDRIGLQQSSHGVRRDPDAAVAVTWVESGTWQRKVLGSKRNDRGDPCRGHVEHGHRRHFLQADEGECTVG